MKTVLISITFTVCLLLHSPAWADIDKQQAVSIANQVWSGRVLAVKRKGNVYRVKKLNDKGEVRTIVIDAQDGKVIAK